MDETTVVTKQVIEEGRGTLLRVGEREYFYTERWYAQPSGLPVDGVTANLLDALAERADELAPEEPKPIDLDEAHREVLEVLQRAEDTLAEELGRSPRAADRYKLCPSELASQLWGRTDSVAVAAVEAALARPFVDLLTVADVFRGEQECC